MLEKAAETLGVSPEVAVRRPGVDVPKMVLSQLRQFGNAESTTTRSARERESDDMVATLTRIANELQASKAGDSERLEKYSMRAVDAMILPLFEIRRRSSNAPVDIQRIGASRRRLFFSDSRSRDRRPHLRQPGEAPA